MNAELHNCIQSLLMKEYKEKKIPSRKEQFLTGKLNSQIKKKREHYLLFEDIITINFGFKK